MNPIEHVHNLQLLASTVTESLLLEDPEIAEIQLELNNLFWVITQTRPEERESKEILSVIGEIEKRLQIFLYT